MGRYHTILVDGPWSYRRNRQPLFIDKIMADLPSFLIEILIYSIPLSKPIPFVL